MTESIYSRLDTLEKTHKMKQQSMLSEKEYLEFKKNTMKAIYAELYISPECVERANTLLKQNILTPQEYDKLKKKLLKYSKQSNKTKTHLILEFICSHNCLYYPFKIILFCLNLIIQPILFFINVIVIRGIFRIK